MKKCLVGIDEVGRGCLAGALTVAAVCAPANSKFQIKNSKFLRGIKDSKKLSAKQREEWNFKLKAYGGRRTFGFAIASVGPQIIDRIGISASARLAVGRCLKKLVSNFPALPAGRSSPTSNFHIVLDGSLYAPRTYLNQETIVKGDEKIPLIAAASIIAKVYRDKKMVRLAEKFPKYGLDIHKGYGTKLHQKAIKKHDLSELHRRSFCGNIKL